MREPGEQRDALVATIRNTADWRRRKAYEFAEDRCARKASLRAAQALRVLANFVEGLPDDDPDLTRYALRRVGMIDGRLALAPDASFLLSRFGVGKGSWQASKPTEPQMRNILRRINGVETQKRGMLATRRRGEEL
jgi:hypothetical protein